MLSSVRICSPFICFVFSSLTFLVLGDGVVFRAEDNNNKQKKQQPTVSRNRNISPRVQAGGVFTIKKITCHLVSPRFHPTGVWSRRRCRRRSPGVSRRRSYTKPTLIQIKCSRHRCRCRHRSRAVVAAVRASADTSSARGVVVYHLSQVFAPNKAVL